MHYRTFLLLRMPFAVEENKWGMTTPECFQFERSNGSGETGRAGDAAASVGRFVPGEAWDALCAGCQRTVRNTTRSSHKHPMTAPAFLWERHIILPGAS